MNRIETIGDATLYLGDCREIMPTLPRVDSIVTDQPYGTGWVRGGGKNAGDFAASGEHPAWDVWNTDWIDLAKAETIAAFCPSSRLRDLLNAFGGGQLRTYVKSNGDNRFHPTQKPTPLMEWLVSGVAAPGETVLDPFMGSGTTGIAALRRGCKFVGIEIEPAYFDVACRRIEDEAARPDMFAPREPELKQVDWHDMWTRPFEPKGGSQR